MEFLDEKLLSDLKGAIVSADEGGYCLLILTLPGTGMRRFLKEIGEMKNLEVVNLDWGSGEETMIEVEKIYNNLGDKKMVLTVNYPGVLGDKKLGRKPLWSHFYKKYYFGVRSGGAYRKVIKSFNESLEDAEVAEIEKKSGGIVQLAKCMALGGEGLEMVIKPIKEAVENCSKDILDNLGWKGSDLVNIEKKIIDIEIKFDLSVIESGSKNDHTFTKTETDILRVMVENGGGIGREKVSDIKWGVGKYDEFSDQAINKQMRRLSGKLQKYKIVTIPKVGYKIEAK